MCKRHLLRVGWGKGEANKYPFFTKPKLCNQNFSHTQPFPIYTLAELNLLGMGDQKKKKKMKSIAIPILGLSQRFLLHAE